MSVYVSRQKVAYSEFEFQLIRICNKIDERAKSLPSRYKKYLNPKLYGPMNQAYRACIRANETYSRTADGLKKRNGYIVEAIKAVYALQEPLLALWNIKQAKEGGMVELRDMMNREIALLYGVLKMETPTQKIEILPIRKMERLTFLGKMGELHRYSYQKIGHAPESCFIYQSQNIQSFVDAALADVVLANRKEPESRDELEKRTKHLKSAVANLNGLQTPLLSFWNVNFQSISENVMDEWAGMINEEIALLEGLMKSDEKRFKSLR